MNGTEPINTGAARPSRTVAALALLPVSVALVASETRAGGGTSTSALNSKIKKLKKQVTMLQTQVLALQLEQGKPRPPTGSAGGDLTGSYPNPQIPVGVIGSDEITTDAVNAAEISSAAVGSAELAGLALVSDSKSVVSGGTDSVTVACPAGTDIISGSAAWQFPSGPLSGSQEAPGATIGWRAEGQNEGMATQDLLVQALCLQVGT